MTAVVTAVNSRTALAAVESTAVTAATAVKFDAAVDTSRTAVTAVDRRTLGPHGCWPRLLTAVESTAVTAVNSRTALTAVESTAVTAAKFDAAVESTAARLLTQPSQPHGCDGCGPKDIRAARLLATAVDGCESTAVTAVRL